MNAILLGNGNYNLHGILLLHAFNDANLNVFVVYIYIYISENFRWKIKFSTRIKVMIMNLTSYEYEQFKIGKPIPMLTVIYIFEIRCLSYKY